MFWLVVEPELQIYLLAVRLCAMRIFVLRRWRRLRKCCSCHSTNCCWCWIFGKLHGCNTFLQCFYSCVILLFWSMELLFFEYAIIIFCPYEINCNVFRILKKHLPNIIIFLTRHKNLEHNEICDRCANWFVTFVVVLLMVKIIFAVICFTTLLVTYLRMLTATVVSDKERHSA